MSVGHSVTSETMPLVGMSATIGKRFNGRTQTLRRRFPASKARREASRRLQADALRCKSFRDRLLHPVEDAGPDDRNHDRGDDCQKKGLHDGIPLYSAAEAAAERASAAASRAFCCSSQRL